MKEYSWKYWNDPHIVSKKAFHDKTLSFSKGIWKVVCITLWEPLNMLSGTKDDKLKSLTFSWLQIIVDACQEELEIFYKKCLPKEKLCQWTVWAISFQNELLKSNLKKAIHFNMLIEIIGIEWASDHGY